MQVKVVAFNGSPRKGGNTERLIKHVFKSLEKEGIDCELFNIFGRISSGCSACLKCRETKNKRCAIETDDINFFLEKMLEADGIIIGSPTYFATLNAETKALIDRTGYVAGGNDKMLRLKAGAAVAAVRRAGALNVFQAINNFFLVNEMVVPGSIYWNLGVGRAVGDVDNDQEGITIMEKLGENMAWLLQKINS